VTSPERLAALFAAMTSAGFRVLVMGGHAVRHYGIDRTTIDYDFAVANDATDWTRLAAALREAPRVSDFREAHSWRPADFRRFVVGTLPDGRDELVECWRRNHLLAAFSDLEARREDGEYGGARVAFLGLSDLIRSKETEREDDWRDVLLLEEIQDLRNLAAAGGTTRIASALASLRSRRGYELAVQRELVLDEAALDRAGRAPAHVLAAAFLAPHARRPVQPSSPGVPPAIAELLGGALQRVTPASPRHLALVEAVRRLYKREAMLADRLDKEAASRG
jgi:hypothetical protein